jgi:hypothetical protein
MGNRELRGRIENYLSSGGLWNPEQMDHSKVRVLLMECHAALEPPGFDESGLRPDFTTVDRSVPAPAPLTPDSPAVAETGEMTCKVTGNPCGSDTWQIGHPCKCENCQAWLAAQAPRVAETLTDDLEMAKGLLHYVTTCCRCHSCSEQAKTAIEVIDKALAAVSVLE